MLLSELASLEFGKVITAFLKQRCKGNTKIKKWPQRAMATSSTKIKLLDLGVDSVILGPQEWLCLQGKLCEVLAASPRCDAVKQV